MNFSIYIKLWIANKFGKVKINPEYKHLEYMIEKKFVTPILDTFLDINGWSMPTHSNWYTITTTGKEALWNEGKHLVTRLISIIALIISLIALLVNLKSKL